MKIFRPMGFEIIIRVVADMAIVNVTFLTALVARLLWEIAKGDSGVSAHAQLTEGAAIYGSTFWLLSFITSVVYSTSGFYSWGRFYSGRFKALAIALAVSLSYLMFGLAQPFVLTLDWQLRAPRMALFLGWFLTLVVTLCARLWSTLWRLVIKRETPPLRVLNHDEPSRKVLVIGGAGYIGSVLCRQLLSRGYSVRVLDAILYGRESLGALEGNPHFELLEGESRDVSAVFRAMLDMDAVVHLGELVGDPACTLDEKLTLEVNLAATRMIAEAAQGYRIKRFVYASSCSVYGASTETLDERSELNPVSLYAHAKIGCERTLLALNGVDFHPVILRLGTVYGLSPRPRFDLVINLLAAKAVCEGEITIFGGEQWRPFVHVEDVARAIILSLEGPISSVKGGIFNVGADEQNYTIGELGKLIQGLIPKARLVNQGNDVDKRDYRVSFAKIRRELGFVPHHTVEEGIREIETALRAGRIADYRAARYSNYKTLSDSSNHLSIRSRHINGVYAPPSQPEAAPRPVVLLAHNTVSR